MKPPAPKAKNKAKKRSRQATTPPAKTASTRKPEVKTKPLSRRLEDYHALFSKNFRDRNPAKKYPAYKQLAKITGFSVSTLQRDMALLRDTYHHPVEFIEKYGGWGYTEEVLKAPTVRMTKSDLVLICTAWSALEGARGTPLADRAAAAFEKLVEALNPEVSVDLQKVRERISFRATNYYAAVDPKVFETVSETLFDDEEMQFDYRKLDRRPARKQGAATSVPPERRHVQPRHLLNHDGAWYLYTDDLGANGERRKFALSRMKAVKSTGVRFEPESDFDIDEEMNPGIGVHNTGREEKVRLRFTGVSAQLIAERHWHGTQQLQQNADGSLELTLSVVLSPELDHWLFRWEDEVEILEPVSLKQAMKEKLRRMAEKMDGI